MVDVDTNNQDSKKSHGYWRSLETLSSQANDTHARNDEFAKDASELTFSSEVDRRKFFGILGSSFALAGVTATGCIRKPKEKILPYSKMAEDVIPGKANYFASAMYVAGSVHGVVVESHDGRPTKIDGNPVHPGNMGSSNSFVQAAILDLYDGDRSQKVLNNGAASNFQDFYAALEKQLQSERATGGSGLAFLLDAEPSPTQRALLRKIQSQYPKVGFYYYDHALPQDYMRALKLAGVNVLAHPQYNFDKANVVLSIDADFLGLESNSIACSRGFADARRVNNSRGAMNRLYSVEGNFSSTGMMADNRLKLSTGKIGEFARALAKQLMEMGMPFPETLKKSLSVPLNNQDVSKWISKVASDLVMQRGKSLVIVGKRQPAWVQALGFAINSALQNTGATVSYAIDSDSLELGASEDLAVRVAAGEIKTLLILGRNPIYDAAQNLNIKDQFQKIGFIAHVGYYADETAALSTWHVPMSHSLESWNDLRHQSGVTSIAQPLIEPLFTSVSKIGFLNKVTDPRSVDSDYEVVRKNWSQKNAVDFEKQWSRWLNDGVMAAPSASTVLSFQFDNLAKVLSSTPAGANLASTELEALFTLDSSVYDGSFSNNAWLQELPDPLSKLTWDNAAYMSPKTLKEYGLTSEDLVSLNIEGNSMEIPVFEVPGLADFQVVLPLGYGREFKGQVATGAGFNVNKIRSAILPYFALGVKVTKTGKKYKLASTQTHGSMEGRALVREATLDQYKAQPNFVEASELLPIAKQNTLLWDRPNVTVGQQWGMTVDLNVCTGCNACTIACQAENNIPVVGKERVLNGRELHWIRLDRYFNGAVDDPEIVFQPVPCMQCENAPCESVCPVAATVHSPSGLNDMAYNRCIGTRYCSNNCPYKVRRFNFLHYAKENSQRNALAGMQQNPNVTVRFRGTMEKCTYCVQRINSARIEAKNSGRDEIADGRIQTACQQVCPTKAIVFGDVNDPNSQVSLMKKQDRNYAILGDLNTKPRTTYLAKLRFPNPDLV